MAYFAGVQPDYPASLDLNNQRAILSINISSKAGLSTAPSNRAPQGHASSPILLDSPVLARQATEELLARDATSVAEDAERSHEWIRANLDPGEWGRRLVEIYAELTGPRARAACDAPRGLRGGGAR